MPVEIIGMIGVKPEGADGAAVHVIGGGGDTRWLRDFAQSHERAGFNRVLVRYTTTSAEGFAVTGYAAAHTERLSYLIAHRPGFVTPTLTARAAATLDHHRRAVAAGHLGAHQRDPLAAVAVEGVVQRIEAADQQGGAAGDDVERDAVAGQVTA